ncbi:hypothetical protein BJV82DRAFT_574272 [Fennellomyces sp. T-0311]|nr:hypothetical protein BJV82DRAFT_574272 [Fennellomyces sp. T-0311]
MFAPSRRILFQVYNTKTREFVGMATRNAVNIPASFASSEDRYFVWDGSVQEANTGDKSNPQRRPVPSGQTYTIQVWALKVFGNSENSEDYNKYFLPPIEVI